MAAGRSLEGQQPKYLNSPETPLFHKGHVLFNFASAREAARAGKPVIVAEGYMDVIALDARRLSGCRRTAWHGADSGSAPPVVGDGADAHALLRRRRGGPEGRVPRARSGALPYLEPGRSLQFVFLPEGRDPDDMVRGGETETLAKLVTQPVALIDVLWSREQARHRA